MAGFGNILRTVARAAWNEAKHRRGQPGNRGQFASGGGGGAKPSGGQAKPPPLPKFGAQPKGRRANPKFSSIAHPPPLPGARNRPSMPGSGKPPVGIGKPKNESEAREHLIWLMGRASMLRRQAQAGNPLSEKQQNELKLSINLARQIHSQHFSEEALARKENPEKEQGGFKMPPLAKPDDPFGMPTVAERVAAEREKPPMRHNPDLDEFMEKPVEQEKPAAQQADMRHNPVLDEFMAQEDSRSPATSDEPQRFPSRHTPEVTYGYQDDQESDDAHFDRRIRSAKRRENAANARVVSIRDQLQATEAAGPEETPEIADLKRQHAELTAKIEALKAGKKVRKRRSSSKAFRLPPIQVLNS